MKKIFIFLSIIIVLIIGGYLYVQFHVLKTKEIKPDESKAISAVDLRPAIIAKLQELVKNGSNGLYNLSVGKIEPHVILSKLEAQNVVLSPDTAVMARLNKEHLLPDDIFKISFTDLHIDGIGIEDLLHKDEIDLKTVHITDPIINVYHKKRRYNAAERKKNDTITLYHRLMKQMKKISVDKIIIEHATVIDHDLENKNVTKYNDVTLNMSDLLVDSTTEYNRDRFLFAKQAELNFKNYVLPTSDSLYYLKAGSVSISGEKHSLKATNVAVIPRGDIEQFEKKLSSMKERYDVKIPELIFSDINWWELANHESFIAKRGEININNGTWKIYLDRTLPQRNGRRDNFPHQLLMRLPIPLSVNKINIHNCNISYEEFEPKIFKSGTITINKINAQIINLTNIPSEVKRNRYTVLNGASLFMNQIPMTASFKLDLQNYKSGNFAADIHMDGGLDSSILNPFAENMGLFLVKKGRMVDGVAHIEGDNSNAKGKITLLYNDLHIIPLKSKENKNGALKKKSITSFIANTFLIKNDNPSKGKETRSPDFSAERDHHSNFFNFIWKGILIGILKTIGVPAKFANR